MRNIPKGWNLAFQSFYRNLCKHIHPECETVFIPTKSSREEQQSPFSVDVDLVAKEIRGLDDK